MEQKCWEVKRKIGHKWTVLRAHVIRAGWEPQISAGELAGFSRGYLDWG